jgi:hypothetical protein
MNKLHKWFGVATALLLMAPTLDAQQNYFQFAGGPYDHGTGREVIPTINPANFGGYVVVGTARTPMTAAGGNNPVVMVSEYTAAGPGPGNGIPFASLPPFDAGMYPINNGMPAVNMTADGMSIAAAAPFNVYGVLAYTDFTTPTQSVLFEINPNLTLNGVQTSLGDLRATSVIFDPNINAFIVLGQSPNNGGDLQLLAVAVGGGIIFSMTYDSGPGNQDVPARLMLDQWTNNYVLIGSSYDLVMGDQDVFVVRVGNGMFGFPLICSETIGSPIMDETGVDVTWGVNAAGNAINVVLAHTRSNRIVPILIEMNPFACPGFVSSIGLNPLPSRFNMPTAITTDPGTMNYAICGRNFDMSMNGFVAVVSNAYAPLSYVRQGLPFGPGTPGDESLNDILYDPFTNMLVNTGDHQMLNPWGASPANQFYPWLEVTNPLGFDMCPDAQGLQTFPLCPEVAVWNIQNPFMNFIPVTINQMFQFSNWNDQCFIPFREGNPDDVKDKPVGSAAVFPNPAATNFTVAYNVGEADQPVLEVLNMVGEIVLTQNLTPTEKSTEIDVTKLAAGMYIVRIRNGEAELTNEKITIQR